MARKNKARVSQSSKPEEENETQNHQSDPEMDDDDLEKKSLYEILGVKETASQQEIKRAYHRLALRVHPDKNPDDKDANAKFQRLQKVMTTLGDEERRALYDQTGATDDCDLSLDQWLHEFFNTIFKKVTVADIEEFEASYRGSDSEKNDLINLYKENKGNMKRLFCSMLCCKPKVDSHRFMDILDQAIATGEVKDYKAYKTWAKKISATKPPKDPLRRKRSRKEAESDLVAILHQNRERGKKEYEAMCSSLESRFGGEYDAPEPTEEEFAAIQRRMDNRRPSKKFRDDDDDLDDFIVFREQ